MLEVIIFLQLITSSAPASTSLPSASPLPPYQPTWSSLDSRPLPPWYDAAKIGIKLSWGVSSVPSYRNEWFWYSWKGPEPDPLTLSFLHRHYPPNITYQELGKEFTAELFDPEGLAAMLEASGGRYVVFTSKHHDGYTLYPSAYSWGWNSVELGPHRDLISQLSRAIRTRTKLRFGLYHSLYEWFHPLYLEDKRNGFKTREFVRGKVIPEMKELIERYEPEVLWSDGDWEADEVYWGSKEFIAWLYNWSRVKENIVINDRWGNGTSCRHGGVWNCQDRYDPGILQPHKWENACSIDKRSWCHRRDAKLEDYLTPAQLISTLVRTVSCGGNFLLNVAPTKEGTLPPIVQERLRQLGRWLGMAGEGIYSTVPWVGGQNDSVAPGLWYTAKPKEGKIFAFLLDDEGRRSTINLGSIDPRNIQSVKEMGAGAGGKLRWGPCQGSGGRCVEGIWVEGVRPKQWATPLIINTIRTE